MRRFRTVYWLLLLLLIAVAIGCPKKPSAEELYKKGDELYNSQKYEEAIIEFQKVIDNYPDSDLIDKAQYKIAESYRALEKYDEAAEAFQKVMKYYPKSETARSAEIEIEKVTMRVQTRLLRCARNDNIKALNMFAIFTIILAVNLLMFVNFQNMECTQSYHL